MACVAGWKWRCSGGCRSAAADARRVRWCVGSVEVVLGGGCAVLWSWLLVVGWLPHLLFIDLPELDRFICVWGFHAESMR